MPKRIDRGSKDMISFKSDHNQSNDTSDTNKANDKNEISQESDILSGNLLNDYEQIKTVFDKSSDIVYRQFQIGDVQTGVLIYVDGLVDVKLIDSDVLKPLLNYGRNF